jgi:DNA-binding CsgD family transcriptional regulator
MPETHPLIGRERELLSLASFLDAPADLPSAVLIEGEAGMGKTMLWQSGIDLARERSFAILEARPVAVEAGLSFAALADLLEPVLDIALPALPEPQRRAIEAALLLRASDRGVLDQRAVGTALLGTLRRLAADKPVLLAIDDVQWLDAASAGTLAFALRRLSKEPVAGLFARRTEIGARNEQTWTTDLPTTLITMGPLSLGAMHALVFGREGAVLARPLLRRLHALSRGNPYYALELTRAWQAGNLNLSESAPLPPDLLGLLGTRIAALPRRTRRALAAAAAMSRPRLSALERAEGGDVGAALGRAVSERIVELDGDELRFSHPLLAASAYASVESAERRQLHARLAGVVSDIEERARHLALAAVEPEEAIAAQVESAADMAFRRGAPSSAADLMAEATRLTPADTDVDHRRRAFAEAEYRFEAGETGRAAALIAALIDRTPPGIERARLLARQARFRHFGEDIRGSVALLREALAEAGDDPGLHVEIEEGLVWGLLMNRDDIPGAAAHARSAVHHAERLGSDAALAEALAALAMTEALVGQDARPTIEKALALEPATLGLRVLRQPSFAHGYLLNAADDLDAARAVFIVLQGRAEERGDDSSLAPIFSHLSLIECLAGHLELAESLAEDAVGMALQSGQVPSQTAALGRKALVFAMRGDLEATRELAGRSLALAHGDDFDPTAPQAAAARGGELAIWALGHVSLALGDYPTAHLYLGPLCDFLLEAGIEEPGEIRPLGDEIEALAALGRMEDADRLTQHLERMGTRTGRPSVLGVARRSRAIVAAAGGEVEAAIVHAEGAVADHRTAGMPMELARSQLVLGEIKRRLRLKRAARDSLGEALEGFERLGAQGWAGRASAELGRIGGRASSTSEATELTATERRAAELVADGHSNKEIASLMFISPKTVEANLSRVYAKTGVASRTELVRHMATETGKT